LVERGGSVRSFHVKSADKVTVAGIVTAHIKPESRLFTDESRLYTGAEAHVLEHDTVNHSRKEYARGEVHTNNIESYFSVFKRGMRGTYQHCREKHLHRYLAEFDFRHNARQALGVDDQGRAMLTLKGVTGSVSLSGKASGIVYTGFSLNLASAVTSRSCAAKRTM